MPDEYGLRDEAMEAWERFERDGSVEAYLAYRALSEALLG